MKRSEIYVWADCDPTIAAAIDTFSERWGPYSTKSRKYSIYRLVREIIDPSWQKYVAALEPTSIGSNLLKGQVLSELAQKHGFRALEDWIIGAFRSYVSLSKAAKMDINDELTSTLETIRELSIACRLKQPRKASIGINTLRARPICELCGQPTELEEYRRRGEWMDDSFGNARLSGRYCVAHRPWHHDGSYNPDYKRAIRNKAKYENELSRLGRQASKTSKPCANTGDAAIDLFVLNLVAQRGLYSDEENELRNIARHLIEERVSDSKKRIIILAASGLKQSEIAGYLDISPQAVSKALKTVPSEYRFDVLKRALHQRTLKSAGH